MKPTLRLELQQVPPDEPQEDWLGPMTEAVYAVEPTHKYSGWPGKTLCGAYGISSISNDDVTCPDCKGRP